MDQYQTAVHNMSAAFRRLSRAENPAEIREVVKEIQELHIPACEFDDRVLAAAARSTLRWMARERLEARIKLAGSLSLKAAG